MVSDGETTGYFYAVGMGAGEKRAADRWRLGVPQAGRWVVSRGQSMGHLIGVYGVRFWCRSLTTSPPGQGLKAAQMLEKNAEFTDFGKTNHAESADF